MAVRKRIDIILGARDQASRVLGGFRRRVMRVMRSVMLLGGIGGFAGLALAVRGAIRAGAGFEHTMARVRALTQATEEDFARLSAQAQELGATTEHSASQAAEAMANFALAGFSVNEIMAAMPATLSLASAGQLDVGQASDIAAKLMAGMGLNAAELGDAVDILAKAFTTANTDLTMLGDAMSYVGPVARTAGYDLAEVAAVIQVLSNAGIQGQQAGTALRRMMLSLASPSREAEGLLKKLGVSVNDAAGDMRPMADIIEDLRRSTEQMGTGKRLGILGTIFGARGATGAAALIDAGATSIRNFEKELRSAGGTAQRIAETQMDTLTGSWIRLKSAAEGLAITVFESMKGPLRSGIDMGTKAMQWMRNAWLTSTVIMEFAWENWERIVTLAVLNVSLAVAELGDRVGYIFGEVIPAYSVWLGRNWKRLLSDMDKNIGTFLEYLPEAIGDFVEHAGEMDWADLWEHMWEGMDESFVRTVDKLPYLAEPVVSELVKELKAQVEAAGGDLGEDFTQALVDATAGAAAKIKNALKDAGLPPAGELKMSGAAGAAGRDGRRGTEFLKLGPQFRGLAAIFRATADPAKETARNTAKIIEETRKIVPALKEIVKTIRSTFPMGAYEAGINLFR